METEHAVVAEVIAGEMGLDENKELFKKMKVYFVIVQRSQKDSWQPAQVRTQSPQVICMQ